MASAKKSSPRPPSPHVKRGSKGPNETILKVHGLQIPVDTYVAEIEFFDSSTTMIRVVATGVDPGATGSLLYAQKMEYWHDNGVAITEAKLHLRMTANSFDERQIGRYTSGYRRSLVKNQVPAGWVPAPNTANIDANTWLYKTADPDDPKRNIGLLLQQAAPSAGYSNLTRVIWFKAIAPDQQNPFIFTKASALRILTTGLQFDLVRDSNGNHTANPYHIDTSPTWYQPDPSAQQSRKPKPPKR